MRGKSILRFLIIAFAAGAFVGLISGLAFGSSKNNTAKKQTAKTAAAAATSEASSQSSQGSTSVSEASGAPKGMTADKARAIGANEMGEIPVLMYQMLGPEQNQTTVTPEQFRNDLDRLKSEGYYPVTVRDLASGNIDIPAGKSAVVITFDDSSPNQYKIREDGSIDPDCAVAIMQQAAKAGDWAERASFFPQITGQSSENNLFGQKDTQQEKLRNLAQWGYEVGSRTMTRANLQKASAEKAAEELALSKAKLESLIGNDYRVTSLSLPFGAFPKNDAVLASGESGDESYAYSAALKADGGVSPSPFSTKFMALHINRVNTSGDGMQQALDDLKKHTDLRYVSDGDPTTVSAPNELDGKLGGIRTDLGRPVVRY